MSTERVVVAWTMVVDRGDEQDLQQRGADHDLRRHAEQVDHRRHHDEAAADAEQDGEHARDEAEAAAAPAARCRGPSGRSASASAASAISGLWRRAARACARSERLQDAERGRRLPSPS